MTDHQEKVLAGVPVNAAGARIGELVEENKNLKDFIGEIVDSNGFMDLRRFYACLQACKEMSTERLERPDGSANLACISDLLAEAITLLKQTHDLILRAHGEGAEPVDATDLNGAIVHFFRRCLGYFKPDKVSEHKPEFREPSPREAIFVKDWEYYQAPASEPACGGTGV